MSWMVIRPGCRPPAACALNEARAVSGFCKNLLRDRLDRDAAVDDGIRRLVDAAHPAFADQPNYPVLTDLLHLWVVLFGVLSSRRSRFTVEFTFLERGHPVDNDAHRFLDRTSTLLTRNG